jgi:hypothetical protein
VEQVHVRDHGLDLIGVHNTVSIVSTNPNASGWAWHADTLVVSMLVDDGEHTLLIKHRNSDWSHSVKFTALPEHGQLYLQIVEGRFPVTVRPYRSLNEYALLVDGVGIGAAYLTSDPM